MGRKLPIRLGQEDDEGEKSEGGPSPRRLDKVDQGDEPGEQCGRESGDGLGVEPVKVRPFPLGNVLASR